MPLLGKVTQAQRCSFASCSLRLRLAVALQMRYSPPFTPSVVKAILRPGVRCFMSAREGKFAPVACDGRYFAAIVDVGCAVALVP